MWKKKEVIVDPKRLGDCSQVFIHGNIIEKVWVIDRRLTWKAHIDLVCSKFQQRLCIFKYTQTDWTKQKSYVAVL